MSNAFQKAPGDKNIVEETEVNDGEQQLVDLLLNGAVAQELGLGDRELSVALALANLQLRSGNGEKALALYAMLVLCRPLDVEYQCGLANCALQMQEYEIALQAASAVVGMAPTDCRGYYFSGASCLGLGHLAEAREDIADALAFAGNSAQEEIRHASWKLTALLDTSLA